MKLVREYINEKFQEEGDPINDMGIGLFNKRNFSTLQEALDFMWNILPILLGGKIPEDIIYRHDQGFFNEKYGHVIVDYIKKYLFIDGQDIDKYINKSMHGAIWHFNNALHNALLNSGYELSDNIKKHKIYDDIKYKDNPNLKIKI